jgi:hypothetical protein
MSSRSDLPPGHPRSYSGNGHGLLVEKPTLCNTIIVDFLTTDRVPTMAPIRQA